MTAAQAIKHECKQCANHRRGSTVCQTKICHLAPYVWDGPKSKVKQIRAHCLECAGTTMAVSECEGKVARGGNNKGICHLHPYRFGRNPRRTKVAPTEKSLAALRKLHGEDGAEGANTARIDDQEKVRGRVGKTGLRAL